jgi:hypothetical protein
VSWRDLTPLLAVMRGAERQNPELADWVQERYGLPVVDVQEDRIHLGPRLTVWLRSAGDARAFHNARGSFDAARQRAIGEAAGRPGVFVIFDSADEELRERALGQVDETAYTAAAAAALDDPSTMWKAYALFGQIFVFLHTDAQAAAVRGTPAATRITDAVWALARERDEFGVVPRASMNPVFDSKQTLDEKYEGSSYYYHR